MGRVIFFLLNMYWAGLALADNPTTTSNANKNELALKLLELQQQQPRYENIARRYLNQLSERPGTIDHSFLSKYQTSMQWSAVQQSFADTLSQTYSAEELHGIIRFLQSNAGQAYLQKTPLINQQNAKYITQRIRDLEQGNKP